MIPARLSAGFVSVAGAVLLVTPTACTTVGGDGGRCLGGKCDSLGDGFHGALEGRSDPIAQWLRGSGVSDEGVIDADYADVLFGVAQQQGCDKNTIKTFQVSDDLITGSEAFPRLVSTVCSNDATRASEFFISAAFESMDAPGEMDLQSIEMFAWDANARAYRFYETFPDDGGIRVDPSPTRCRQCHLTSADMAPTAMHMTPIMNELTRPWTHWNAEPGFPSHDFSVPERVLTSESRAQLVAPFLGQAPELEAIIRAGHDRVASARLRERRDSVSLDKVMGLLRPVFCSEQVNYVSEDFASGILFNTVALDPGFRNMYLQISASNWPWSWANDQTMRLPAPTGRELVQIPVRGNADATVENLLVSTRVLTPQQILQVRALDWQRPVFSPLRCNLWSDAEARFRAEPPDLAGASRVSDAIPIVFAEIMKLGSRAIASGAADKLISVPVADAEQISGLFSALIKGTLAEASCETDGFCLVDLDQLGAQLEAHLDGIADGAGGRDWLLGERDRRICHVIEKVKAVDERFDDASTQRECAASCCGQFGKDGDEICIGQAAEAARNFDTREPEWACATECATPSRFTARPSLPDTEGCEFERWMPFR